MVRNELQTELKENIHYTCDSCVSPVAENFYGYQNSLIAHGSGQNPIRPKLPHYRNKGGLHEITYPAQAFKKKYDENGQAMLGLPLGWDIKKLYGEDIHQIDYIWIPYPTNINPNDIIEVSLSPQNGELYAVFVYKLVPVDTVPLDYNLALGIDHGVNNWLTCIPNTGKRGFVVDGRQLKQFNQFYHKQIAKAKTDQPQGFWNNHLDRITAKRNRRMHDATNKAARVIIDYCLAEGIGNIVFGWNKGQSQSTKMGRQNNQNFATIPTGKVKERLRQLCELYGIWFYETEESYTSQSSFFDHDDLHVFGEKPESWKPSGKREKRGLYVTAKGFHISSDANGGCNILRKVADAIGVSLDKIAVSCCQFLDRIYLWKRKMEQNVKAQQLAAKAIGAD